MWLVETRLWLFGVSMACCTLYPPAACSALHYYVDLSLVGSELEGPKPTTDWDLGLYRGISINPAVGLSYRKQKFDLALQFERFDHTTGSLGHSSELRVNGTMFKAIAGMSVYERWRLFFGLGRGIAEIAMDNSACLANSGCGFSPYPYPPVRADSHLSATLVGVAWEFVEGWETYAGFQRVSSGGLGFKDVYGTPYAADRLELPTSFIGIRFIF